MKNLKQRLILLMSMILIPALLVACKPKVGPDESAKILSEFAIKADESNLSKLGAPQKVIDEASTERKDSSIEEIKKSFTSGGLTVNDGQVQEIYDAMMEAFKKTSATTEVVSKTDSTAVIKVKSTYFDMTGISEKAANDAIAQFTNTNITSEDELKNKMTDVFINNLIAGIKNAQISKDTKEKTFNFSLKDKVWLPENESQFFYDLGQLVSGQ